MGMFGGGGGDSGGNTHGVGRKLRRERQKIEDALASYNTMAKPFFGLEQNRGEFGQSFYPMLQQRIANPMLSPSFKLYGDEGIKMLRSNFAQTGSPSSGPAQIAAGRYLAGLGAHQLDTADNMLLAAANFRGILPQTQEPQYLGLTEDLAKQEAMVKAAQQGGGGGGLFSGILGGAAQGASAGSYFGPWGAAIGGIVGGGLGAAGSSK